MYKINLLVIESLEIQRDYLNQYLQKTENFNIEFIGDYHKVPDMLEVFLPDILIANYKVDKGITIRDLIQANFRLNNVPCIIYADDYKEKILQDILNINLVDFLHLEMKKIELDKALALAKIKIKAKKGNPLKFNDYIFVRTGKEIKKLKITDILYVVVDGKYIGLHTAERRYFVRSTLTSMLNRLPDTFIKIHKAYAINMDYMDTINIEESTVKVGKETLPLSRNMKKDLLESFYIS